MKRLRCIPPTDTARIILMRRVRQKGTSAEVKLGELLRALNLRYRKNVRSLPGSPDFANKTRRWAIFVNGCFWHHHKGCSRATIPTRNHAFWLDKFETNQLRDEAKVLRLRQQRFRVLTVWECELGDSRLLRRLQRFAGIL